MPAQLSRSPVSISFGSCPRTNDEVPEDEGAVGTCNSGAAAGTFTYHAEGTASGPYPGTFVEEVTIGAAFRPFSLPKSAPTMKSFHATFTITSGSTIVTGARELPVFAPGFAWCTGTSQPVFYGFFKTTALTYSATIEADGRTYADSGSAKARDATFDGKRAASSKAFTEEFVRGVRHTQRRRFS